MSARHEHEWEGELEYEGEFEDELEGEFEDELEMEGEFEDEGEFEGEQFFRRIGRAVRGVARGVGGFVRRAAPVLRSVARVAAPMIGTAVGGPLGGMIGRVAAQALREGEYEDEMEGEYEDEMEGEYEDEGETEGEAEGEFMAAVASRAQSEAEAEAMVGAAAARIVMSRADRQSLRRILPHLVRGVAVLTRLLRRRRVTRPAVRAVPAVVRRTVATLARRAQTGRPVTRQAAGRAMAAATRRVIGNPRTCAAAISRNVRTAARVAQRRPGTTAAREFEV